MSNFTFGHHLARQLAASYAVASPFPHTFFDDIFPRQTVEAVAAEIPEVVLPHGCVSGAASCYLRRGTHYRKSELHRSAMGPYTNMLFTTLRSPRFVQFLEVLTGISGLVPDPGFEGSGVHLTGDGGVLAVHHDFNWMHCLRDTAGDAAYPYDDCSRPTARGRRSQTGRVRLHRRVNVFIYLNRAWRNSYGGHLELWTRNMSRCAQRILPSLGRFAVFSSTDFSLHGHPTPMRLPRGRMRRSIAFYYYTVDRPSEECIDGDCGTFRDAQWQKMVDGCESCTACNALPAQLRSPYACSAGGGAAIAEDVLSSRSFS